MTAKMATATPIQVARRRRLRAVRPCSIRWARNSSSARTEVVASSMPERRSCSRDLGIVAPPLSGRLRGGYEVRSEQSTERLQRARAVALHSSPRTAQRSCDLSLRQIVVGAKDDNRPLPRRENPKRPQHHQPVSDAADTIGVTVWLGRLKQLDMSPPAVSATPDSRVYENAAHVGLDRARIAYPPPFDEAVSHRRLNQVLGGLAIPRGQQARGPQQSRRSRSYELDVLLVGRHIDLPGASLTRGRPGPVWFTSWCRRFGSAGRARV